MPSKRKPKARRILLLSANPKGTPQLRLDEELRRITDALERSQRRNDFDIRVKPAITIAHIRRELLDNQPEIVHFCGHGAGTDGIACEDEAGQVKLISTSALAGLFELTVAHVRCVVLNACYAEVQAEEVAKHIECVVGMRRALGDRAALSFAEGFYDALGVGKSFDECFRWGVSAIQLESIPEDSTPVFKTKARAREGAPPHGVKTPRPPRPGAAEAAAPRKATEGASRRALLTAALLTALVVAAGTWAASRWWYVTPRLAGHYSQRKFDPPKQHETLPFTVESVASSLVIYVNPSNNKLYATEISTNLISHVEPNGDRRPLAMYTAEWHYEEVERVGSNYLTMRARPLPRHAFNSLGTLLKDSNANVNGDFDRYLEAIALKYAKADSDIKLSSDGSSLVRNNVYEPNVGYSHTFYRDQDPQ